MIAPSIPTSIYRSLAQFLRTLSQPARLEILLALGEQEACVCHLEARLGLRQAYLSQHLMALREAGLVTDRRAGRYIFYRLKEPILLDWIRLTGELAGVAEQAKTDSATPPPLPGCSCPHCASDNTPTDKEAQDT